MPANTLNRYFKNETNLALVLTVLFVFFYNSFFYNKYLPLTEGWFSLYADLMSRGFVPYRDFYLLLTPLYPKFIQLFSFIFGPEFLKLRIFGIFLFAFIAYFVFKISRLFIGSWKSFLISSASIVILESGNAFINYDYIYFYIFLNLIAIYCLLLAKINEDQTNFAYLLFAAGFFASLSFLTKQSNGAFFVSFLFLSTLYAFNENSNQVIKSTFYFSIGALLPLLLTVIWLLTNDSLHLALNQILFQASSSKGSLNTAITKWGFEFFNEHFLSTLHRVFLIFISFWIISRCKLFYFELPKNICCPPIFILVLFVFLATVPSISHLILAIEPITRLANMISTGNYWFVSVLLISLFNKTPGQPKLYKILVIISIGAMWGSGTSAGLTQISLFFTIITIFIFLCNFNFVTSALSFMLLASVLFVYPGIKYQTPFSWWGHSLPPIIESDTKLTVGYAKGIYTSSELAQSYNELYHLMKAGNVHNNTSLVFPHMPIFQLNSNSVPFGKAAVYWFDFISNDLMDMETILLSEKNPQFILIIDVPVATWEGHRKLFRANGAMSHDLFLDKMHSLVLADYMPITKNLLLGGDYQGTLYKLK